MTLTWLILLYSSPWFHLPPTNLQCAPHQYEEVHFPNYKNLENQATTGAQRDFSSDSVTQQKKAKS